MTSPGLDRGPGGHVLGRGDEGDQVERQPQLGDRRDRLEHRGGAGHVHLHLLHAGAGLERDAAGVEGDALADQGEGRAGAAAAVAEDDQLRLLGAALADGEDAAHALRLELGAAEDLGRERVGAGGDLLGPLGEEGRGGDVGGGDLQVAGPVLGLGGDARDLGGVGQLGRPDQGQRLAAAAPRRPSPDLKRSKR